MDEYHEILNTLNATKSNTKNVDGKPSTFDEPATLPDIFDATKARTMRYLRHRELLLEHSLASSVVIM